MDARFARLKTDPRFRRLKKRSLKADPTGTTEDDDERFRASGAGERPVIPVADYARGVILMQSSDEDEEDEDEGSFIQHAEELSLRHGGSAPGETEIQPTRRLALVNLDWDHVRATHLFKICTSVLSAGQGPVSRRILRVSVYPSQFGKERMAREDREGPPMEMFTKKTRTHHITAGSGSEIDEAGVLSAASDSDYDMDTLRDYQLERLRYFYAIVECDTPSTAAHIYEELDGAELEYSANVFDISYVPDDMSFDDEPRDETTELLNTLYKPVDFATDALRHSKVKLTWDEEDPERVQLTRRALTKKEIDDADFKAYIASSPSASGSDGSTSASEAEGEKDPGSHKSRDSGKGMDRERMRALLLGGNQNDLPEGWGSGHAKSRIKDDEEDENDHSDTPSDVDMQITFAPALSSVPDTTHETTLERYKRKEQEKRRARRAERAGMRDQATVGVDIAPEKEKEKDSNATKKKRKTKRKLAEYEGDSDSGASGKEGEDTGFTVDVHDARFASLHEDHAFAIDPSHPRFKKTKGMFALLDERAKRHTTRHGRNSGNCVRSSNPLLS